MRCGIQRGFSYQSVSHAVSKIRPVTVGKSNTSAPACFSLFCNVYKSIYQCQTTDWNKNILKFFLIQEKVYFCERDNLEYVKLQ